MRTAPWTRLRGELVFVDQAAEPVVATESVEQKELARFPQLLVAPALIAVIWQSLFGKHAPLDAIEMFRVHLDLIFGERRAV